MCSTTRSRSSMPAVLCSARIARRTFRRALAITRSSISRRATQDSRWRTRFGTIGVAICWDQWFPESARAMALLGAEILFYPTAIGSEPQDLSIDSRDPGSARCRVMQRPTSCRWSHPIASAPSAASVGKSPTTARRSSPITRARSPRRPRAPAKRSSPRRSISTRSAPIARRGACSAIVARRCTGRSLMLDGKRSGAFPPGSLTRRASCAPAARRIRVSSSSACCSRFARNGVSRVPVVANCEPHSHAAREFPGCNARGVVRRCCRDRLGAARRAERHPGHRIRRLLRRHQPHAFRRAEDQGRDRRPAARAHRGGRRSSSSGRTFVWTCAWIASARR